MQGYPDLQQVQPLFLQGAALSAINYKLYEGQDFTLLNGIQLVANDGDFHLPLYEVSAA